MVIFDNGHLTIEDGFGLTLHNVGMCESVLIYPEEIEEIAEILQKELDNQL